MKQLFEVSAFILIGIFLLWFGYTLFFTICPPALGGFGRKSLRRKDRNASGGSTAGDPKTCPVCAKKLQPGELVSSSAFPALNGSKERFMHIKGCIYCLKGDRERVCPVCGIILKDDEILIARLYDRPGKRSHVHVAGCTRCKGPPSQRKA
jgi:hypothetical protein